MKSGFDTPAALNSAVCATCQLCALSAFAVAGDMSEVRWAERGMRKSESRACNTRFPLFSLAAEYAERYADRGA